jgi:hypothetical protein
MDTWFFSVKKGDVIKLSNNYTLVNNHTPCYFGCYYIPPRNLMLQNYSLDEQDTGQRWIDGRIIYQRSFRRTIPSIAANTSYTIDTVANTGIKQIINVNLVTETVVAGGYWHGAIFCGAVSSTSVMIANFGGAVWTGSPVVITLQYLK